MRNKTFPFLIILITIFMSVSAQKFENLAITPPMGWNSWNYFNCDGINEQTIREVADAMVTSGMKDVGYEYIVIDDCWQIGRDAEGNILADSIKFPSGIKALSDYIHSRGLKFGIYSCAGTKTCQNLPGSRGYEFQDARIYAEWGVDFLKYDWCNTGEQSAKDSYSLMRDALYKAGRTVLFSMCEWGLNKPWLWANDVAHIWRTTGDIRNNWIEPDAKEGKVWGGGVMVIFDMQKGLEQFAGPGHWNDPDMLEVGNGVLTETEEITHFSLWSMLAAPLMAGNDLRNMSDKTKSILTNKEAIAINQDPLGKQAYCYSDDGDFEIWVKILSADEKAICLLNRSQSTITVPVDFEKLNKAGDDTFSFHSYDIKDYKVRDIWELNDLTLESAVMETEIPSHGVKLYRFKKK
jgi:alpha-galactosidase